MVNASDPTLTLAQILSGIITDDGRSNLAVRAVVASENSPPSNILLSNNTVDDGSGAGIRVGILTVIDANADDTHELSIVTDPDDKFDIENPTTGETFNSYLILKNTVDFATKVEHQVLVKAVDPTGLSVDVLFTIEVVQDFTNALSTSFDAIDESLNGGDIHQYDASDAFSIAVWVKPQNVAAQRTIFSKATNDANVWGYILSHTNTGAIFLQMRASGTLRQHIFTSTLTAAVWQLLVFTYEGAANISGAKAYLNAVVGNTPVSGTLNGYLSGQDFTVGARNTVLRYSGLMDEMSVWDKALTQAEITELYNSGVPYDISQHSAAETNLQSWYRMGDNDTHPTILDNINTADLTMVNMDSGNFVADVP